MNLIRRLDLRVRQVDGETLVLDDQEGLIHQLNETASFVWHQCDGKTSIADIVSRFASEFEVDESRANQDVAAVITKLTQLKLVQEIP